MTVPNRVKRRKAYPAGELAFSSEVPISVGAGVVLATGWSLSLLRLPMEICRAPLGAVVRRTQGQRTMTRQKSESRIGPQSRRKSALTRDPEQREGGKATPVNEQTGQLRLPFETAEEFPAMKTVGVDAEVAPSLERAATRAMPESKDKKETAPPVTMEEVSSRLEQAFQKVAANKGAPGPDRQSIDEVRKHLSELVPRLVKALLEGTYRPGDIRRVWIPKSGGGQRGLGIPDVVDRMIQEAVRQVLEPLYEPTFHDESHGFRPGRSCHTAIAQARQHVEDGYEWLVDLDLEKFFDRVNHQRLMARLAQRVDDRRLLVLIGQMLKAKVVMPDGVVVATDEGVPQGGPLSPLLSNVVLDELDSELSRRGHRFVRYADDCNIYVRSQRAGERVMAHVVNFIERRLRLKVNAAKSAVARPEERHFLGFRIKVNAMSGDVDVLLSKRSQERIETKVRELTPRNWGNSLRACIRQVNVYLLGWLGFFAICTAGGSTLHELDAHIRRRLRALQLKQWKRKRTIARRLIALGVKPQTAWRTVYEGCKSLWTLSQSFPVQRALPNRYFAERGLVSLQAEWEKRLRPVVAPGEQLLLPLG